MKVKIKILLLLTISTLTIFILILNILVNTHKIYNYEVNRVNTKQKVVMLTFDDGPEASADNAILDILEKEKVSGMFFQIGQNIDHRLYNKDPNIANKYLALQRRILTGPSYSWIGSHTYSHLNYLNRQKLAVQELNHTYKLLQKIYQNILKMTITPELVPTRFAYLQYFNGMDYIGQKTNNKYFIRGYLGTDYNEERSGKNKILQEYLSHLRPGQIFVCHTRNYAKLWLPELVRILKEKGYQFASFNPNSPHYYQKYGKLVN
ncbi:polysaccharide deacetylase family protein [Spiroplasma sp. DGKH1]|uniref:polysaccharide deacetylase family protein n=1 Tax=Spiroplasma sp. DGKH1 TaxID=3050074 RepID=UPI0034C6DC62